MHKTLFDRVFKFGATTALCLSALSAHAAVYSGDWDPAFGPQFPNLGYNGAITFFVPDACLTQGGNPFNGFVTNADVCSSGAMDLLTAQVGLYDLSNPNAILDTLVFAPPQVLPNPIFGVYIEYDAQLGRNFVTGLLTDFIGPQQSSLAIAGNNSFLLSFGRVPLPNQPLPSDYGVASILATECGDQVEGAPCQSNYATVRFSELTTQIPEPGTLALVAGALGLACALGRRRG